MALLLFYLLLAICVSFFCSIAEAVLLSIRPSYIASMEERGARGAETLNKLQSNIDKPLAAILTANTIAHTIGAAGVGAQSAVVFGDAYLGATSGVLTLLILVFSEIIPKTLGATYWKGLAPIMGTLILWLTIVLYPFVWLSEKLTRVLSRESGKETFSRDEMRAMAEIGKKEGLLDNNEYKIVANLMKLKRLSIRDIMTPRTVMFAAPASMTVQDFFNTHGDNRFSRIPLFIKDAEDIQGYALRHDLLFAQAKDEFDRTLKEFIRKCPALPVSLNAWNVFDALMREKSHFAVVVEEFGSVVGIVTFEDIFETLIGFQITDELDEVDDMRALARDLWRERMKNLGVSPDQLEKFNAVDE